jgi:hypothetical protein
MAIISFSHKYPQLITCFDVIIEVMTFDDIVSHWKNDSFIIKGPSLFSIFMLDDNTKCIADIDTFHVMKFDKKFTSIESLFRSFVKN